jgi:hypothetical protein
MRQAKEFWDRAGDKVTCTFDGYGDDPRDLADIPEAREFCKRLVGLGYISFLDVTTSMRGLPAFDRAITLGAWEV